MAYRTFSRGAKADSRLKKNEQFRKLLRMAWSQKSEGEE